MTTYAIGDIHGSTRALDRLLTRLETAEARPRLWFVGDLVNRGPNSAAAIRRVRDLGESAITVLGNHDLSLLALAQRPDAREHANASLRDVLEAPDSEELLEWLRLRPLIHSDATLDWTMVHAGIPREWSVDEAHARAVELEQALRGPEHPRFLAHLFGNTPSRWDPSLDGIQRLRYIANALTRQRFVYADGALDMDYKKTLAGAPDTLIPWFALSNRASANRRIVFGHWSALEHVEWPEHSVWGIDTGAAWRGQLSALRLDARNPNLIQVDSEE